MLSDRHQAVFDFIIGYKEAHDGISPSIREITESCQISSTSQTNKFLRELQDLGAICFELKQARTIRVVGGRWSFDGDGETKA